MLKPTTKPLVNLSLSPTNRHIDYFVHNYGRGLLLLDAPYQRGRVWTTDQRGNLIRSLLMGVPIPAIVLNRRLTDQWEAANGLSEHNAAVVDGKQRILTMVDWFRNDFIVPSTWFRPDWLYEGFVQNDSTWVSFDDLSDKGRRGFENFAFACVEAQVATVQHEAEIYLLVNGAGTAQTDDDMVNAQRVAEGK